MDLDKLFNADNPNLWAALALFGLIVSSKLAHSIYREFQARRPGQKALNEARQAVKKAQAAKDPAGWAAAQFKLGRVLAQEAKAGPDRAAKRLKEAAKAYRQGLDKCPNPGPEGLREALTANLAAVLAFMGERENNPDLLRQAHQLLGGALKGAAPGKDQALRLDMENNLGHVCLLLARMEGGDWLAQAVKAFEQAANGQPQEAGPEAAAAAQNNLGAALLELGRQQKDRFALNRSVSAFERALAGYTRQQAPRRWADTQYNLGNGLLELGRLEKAENPFRKALQAFSNALEEYSQELAPVDWAMARNNLGACRLELARLLGQADEAAQAVRVFEEVVGHLEGYGAKSYLEVVRRNLADAQALNPGGASSPSA